MDRDAFEDSPSNPVHAVPFVSQALRRAPVGVGQKSLGGFMAWSAGICEWVYVETFIQSIYSRISFVFTLTFHYQIQSAALQKRDASAILFTAYMINWVSCLSSSAATEFILQ